MALKPQTTAGKVTLGAALLAALASFTTVGSAIVMWEQIRPWMSELEEKALADRDKELKARACENTLARLQSSLFQAQANEVEATERSVTLADMQAKALNRKMIQQAREAQHSWAEQYAHEKKVCGF